MTAANLISVLRPLCECDPPEISAQAIAEAFQARELEALVRLGALHHTGNSNTALCFACDYPHPIGVEFLGEGTYRAYCPEAGFQPIDPGLLSIFAVNLNWIADSIATSVGLSARPTRSAYCEVPLARIGRVRFGKCACEVFFACRLSDRVLFDQVRATVATLVGNAPGLILTTTHLHLIPGKPPPRCAHILLEDVLELNSGKPSFNEAPVLAALRGHDGAFPSAGIGYVVSPGFRSCVVGDQEYSFTKKQAEAIECLFVARERGVRKTHKSEIQGELNTSQEIGQLFANHAAYGELIKYDGAGFYWLDL